MQLSPVQKDRAAGVLLGQAVGDALGVPYEFKPPITTGEAFMAGGGLGPYSPGEWSDDTQMAVCIAQVSADGADLSSCGGLDEIAKRFLNWRVTGATDIGNQTSAVIARADSMITGSAMNASMSRYDLDVWSPAFEAAAAQYAASHPRSAGNGALMRNGIVGLTRLADRDATAVAARAVTALTHADPLVAASCVLHAEAVRVAVIEGRLDIRAGLDLLRDDERARWSEWIDEAEREDPKSFKDNGFTVTALQAAWSAISHTMSEQPTPDHVNDALQLAISIGHDTDTVAAIAGALLGARYGVSGLRHDWRQQVHGWPDMRGHDLIRLALMTAAAGLGHLISHSEWPVAATTQRSTRTLGVSLPADPGVVLGAEADLPRAPELGCDAVVSLSRVGAEDRCPESVSSHLEQWLVDTEDPSAHGNLAWALHDAADAVAMVRRQQRVRGGDRGVLLHCAHAEHRTPSMALLYAVKHCCQAPEEAADDIRKALGRSTIDGLLWRTAAAEAEAFGQRSGQSTQPR